MAFAGTAFLALWNDIDRPREGEYDQWHTLEHVPERVAVEGFHGGRRYVNRARAEHRYFTLYDIDSVAALEGREYRDLVEHPTPWSASMRPAFSNFLRVVCTVRVSSGTGIGAAIACLCLPEDAPDDLVRSALEAAQTLPRVNAVHLGARHQVMAAAAPGVAGAKSNGLRVFDRVALIEALDRAAAVDALSRVQQALDLRSLPRDFGADVYELAFVFPSHDPGERRSFARASWLQDS